MIIVARRVNSLLLLFNVVLERNMDMILHHGKASGSGATKLRTVEILFFRSVRVLSLLEVQVQVTSKQTFNSKSHNTYATLSCGVEIIE